MGGLEEKAGIICIQFHLFQIKVKSKSSVKCCIQHGSIRHLVLNSGCVQVRFLGYKENQDQLLYFLQCMRHLVSYTR